MNGLKAQVEGWAREAYDKINEWYSAELKRLAEENQEGKTTESEYNEKVAALAQQAENLRSAVDSAVTGTDDFITEMGGKSTAYVREHLSELQTLADNATQVAAQIDALSPQQKDHGEVSRTLTITGVTQDKSTQFEAIALTYQEYAEMVRAAEEEYAKALEEARETKTGAEYSAAENEAKAALNAARQQAADYYQSYMQQILAGIAQSDPELAGKLDEIISKQDMGGVMQHLSQRLTEEFDNYQQTGELNISISDILGEMDISDEDIAAWAKNLGLTPDHLTGQLDAALKAGDTTFAGESSEFVTGLQEDIESELSNGELDLSTAVPALAAAIQQGYLIPGINGVDYTAGGDLFNELMAGQFTPSAENLGVAETAGEELGKSATSKMGDEAGAKAAGDESINGLDEALKKGKETAEKRGIEAGKAFAHGYKTAQVIQSPSKVMEKLGLYSGKGLDKGLRAAMAEAVHTAKIMSGQIVTAADLSQTMRVNIPNLNQEIKLANEQSSVPINLDGKQIATIQGYNNSARIAWQNTKSAKGVGSR